MATNFNSIVDRFWSAADKLLTNTHLRSNEYFVFILDLIFLKFVDQKFHQVDLELRAILDSGEQFEIEPSTYKDRGAIYLPPEARFNYLLELSGGKWNIGDAIDYAMRLIEHHNKDLQDALPTSNFTQLDNRTLADLLRIIASIPSYSDTEENVFGQIYDHLLDKIALKEGPKGGEFFTPASINKLMIEIVEPYHGSIFDPACGVGGMFVQSVRFAQDQHIDHSTTLSIFGQENTTETVRLCKLNLAMHGLHGNIQRTNSYYEDPHNSIGRFDFVISEPPFNANGVDKTLLWNQGHRFPFGIPQADNANYLWIQMFYSALNEHGRAGFAMPNSASDARFSELKIRRRLIEDRVVDVMISVGSNFFYSTTLPRTLWFLDKGKRHTQRRDQVLFIDARHIYNQLDRSHRNFTPDWLEFLSNIVRLYRGEVPEVSKDSKQRLEETFPKGIYADASALCKIVTIDEIAHQNWSLNPARYVNATEYAASALLSKRTSVFISYSQKDK